MAKHTFKVEPLRKYDGAQYPSIALERDEREEERPSILKLLAVAAVVLWVSAGLVACGDPLKIGKFQQYLIQKSDSGPDGDSDHGDYDIVAGEMVECTPGEAFCSDDQTWAKCTESHDYEYIDCNSYCQDTYGAEWGLTYSLGCDAAAAEPCQCEYDMIDGGIGQECVPGEVYCVDEQTVAVCGDYWFEYSDCYDYCVEKLSSEFVFTTGCDAAATDPCGCEYDMLDGDVAECLPGEVYCADAQTLVTCDNYYPEHKNCDDVCKANDPNSQSAGCDTSDPDDPCNCE